MHGRAFATNMSYPFPRILAACSIAGLLKLFYFPHCTIADC